MTTLREAAQQALEALEWHLERGAYGADIEGVTGNLRAALAQEQAEPVEPVAWRWGYRSVTTGEMDWRGYVEIAAHPNLRSPEIIMEPLYTAPPQRKPLTDEEIRDLWSWAMTAEAERTATTQQHAFARAIERAHGIGGQDD